MKFQLLVGFMLSLLLVGCWESDPYSGLSKDRHLDGDEPPIQAPVKKGNGINIRSILEFPEGYETKHAFDFSVEDGDPILEVDNLPEGVDFDKVNKVIRWVPDFNAANDPKDPAIKEQRHRVTLRLYSTADPKNATEKTVTFVIKDTPQAFRVKGNNRFTFIENKTATYDFILQSKDFPNGPFNVEVDGFPGMIQVQGDAEDPTKFQFSFKPDYEFVNLNNSKCTSSWGVCAVEHEVDVKGFLPDGRITIKKVKFRFEDRRQAPQIILPSEIKQGTDVSFNIQAFDPNYEMEPTIELVKQPDVGDKVVLIKQKVPPVAESGVYQTVMTVGWTDIPESLVGSSRKLSFNVCVKDRRDEMKCDSDQIKVTFVKTEHLPPAMDRSQWEVGHIHYLKLGESVTIPLPIVDQEGHELFKVEEFFNTGEISWSTGSGILYPSGQLEVTPAVVGSNQFSIKATSKFGVEATESFVYEALPATWEETIIFGDSPRDEDVLPLTTWKSDMRFVNPAVMALDRKMLSFRNRLVIGSSYLESMSGSPKAIDKVMSVADEIIVMSPLLNNLPESIMTELSELGVEMSGRLADLGTTVDKLTFAANDKPEIGLKPASKAVKLGGKLTKHSFSPMLIQRDLFDDHICKVLFRFSDYSGVAEVQYALGARCKRKEKPGYITVIGFELGDLVFDPADAELPAEWAKSILEWK